MPIERRTLRAQVRDELLARMRSGEIQPGEGINEVRLAAELGVSRTPLREALIALESEGQIESEDGKGFRFPPLSRNELRELAPIMAALEALALELTDPADLPGLGERLARMAADFNQELAEHALVIRKDDEWHGVMLSACPNTRLLELIASTRQAIHRYESLLVPGEAMVDRVSTEHALIAERMIDGDLPGAVAALRANWLNGMQRIIDSADREHLSA